MSSFSLDDAKLIKILARNESTVLEDMLNNDDRKRLNLQIFPILREYYKENTQGIGADWTKRFKQFGITEDEGKAAIACARRLGIEI